MKVKLTCALLGTALLIGAGFAQANENPIRVGLMLPYSGSFSPFGNAIENGFKLYVHEQGGKLAGRELAYYKVDDESNITKATDNANRLIQNDKVDLIIGTVHSGVAVSLAYTAKETDTTLIVPNAGANTITDFLCGPNILRTSYSNWQPAYTMGKVAGQRGHKTALTIAWRYVAGDDAMNSFREGFESTGGKVIREYDVIFPRMEFASYLKQIETLKPDMVFAFFAGEAASKFIQEYHNAGLDKTIPLYGTGTLSEGLSPAAMQVSQGMLTTMHYGDGLNTPRDNAFREAYVAMYHTQPNVYAVQGYDTAQLMDRGLKSVKGDISKKQAFRNAMHNASIDSPRGSFTLSSTGNPIQTIYLRQIQGEENRVIGIAAEHLATPARSCTQ